MVLVMFSWKTTRECSYWLKVLCLLQNVHFNFIFVYMLSDSSFYNHFDYGKWMLIKGNLVVAKGGKFINYIRQKPWFLKSLRSLKSTSCVNLYVWPIFSWAQYRLPWILEDKPSCRIPSWSVYDTTNHGTKLSYVSCQWGLIGQICFESIQPLLTWSILRLTLMEYRLR